MALRRLSVFSGGASLEAAERVCAGGAVEQEQVLDMLTFLAVACKKKFVMDEYTDEAVGHMEKNENGKMAITRVELHPKITFSGEKQPTEQELDEMHHFAHTECFIANSVKTKVTVEK